jgi:hypothetical protein
MSIDEVAAEALRACHHKADQTYRVLIEMAHPTTVST